MKFLIYEEKKLQNQPMTIKFNDPIIDEIPDIWREKIAKSTDGDEWYKYADNGGYTVHPVPGLG